MTSLLATVRTAFRELGAPDMEPIGCVALLRGGFFVGHRFACGDFVVVWLSTEQDLRFYRVDGSPVEVVGQTELSARKAA